MTKIWNADVPRWPFLDKSLEFRSRLRSQELFKNLSQSQFKGYHKEAWPIATPNLFLANSDTLTVKVAPSFSFLNINMPIFCWNRFWTVSGRRGLSFLAVHRLNVDQIACLFLYVLLQEKAVFEKEV